MSYNAIVAGAAFVRIAMDDASLRQGLKEAQKRVNGFAKSWEVLKNKMSLDTSGSFLYFSNAVMPVANLIEHYKQFSDQMLALKAISGASQAQISALEKYIRHLGATTAFTAKQVAQGAVELSRMGFSSNDVKAGLKPALNLVRATGQETWRLGEISAYAASAVRIFGLQGKDFAHVCDVMAYAANASNADIDDLGEALKIAGPSARTVNEDLRDTASALMLMSNAGIKGSLAGTSLRKIYQSLAAQSGKTAGLTEEQIKEGVRGIEAMRNLGVKVVDTDTGNLRKAADVMRDLAKAVTTLKSGEKVNFATEVFDLRGSLGALSMLNDADALQTFRQKLDDVEGYAEKTAKEMESGIGGVTRTFFSKLQELGLTVGKMAAEVFLPLLKAGISFFDKLAEFVKNNQFAIRFFGGLAMAGLTLGASLKVLSVAMDIVQKSFSPLLSAMSKVNDFIVNFGKNKGGDAAKSLEKAVQQAERIKELEKQKSDTARIASEKIRHNEEMLNAAKEAEVTAANEAEKLAAAKHALAAAQESQKAEQLKVMAQKRADAVRVASENRRHYNVLKNAAREAQMVASGEAQKISSAKARLASLESARFEGQSMKDIAAMSPHSQASFFRASRDYYGAERAREQLAEMQQLNVQINEHSVAYTKAQAAASKAAKAAEVMKEKTLQSAEAAKRVGSSYQTLAVTPADQVGGTRSAEVIAAQKALNEQNRIYQASLKSVEKAQNEVEASRNRMLPSIQAAVAAEEKHSAAITANERVAARRMSILGKLKVSIFNLNGMALKRAALIWKTSIAELAAAKASAAGINKVTFAYKLKALAAKMAAGASLALARALKYLAANWVTVALTAIFIAYTKIRAAIDGARQSLRNYNEEQAEAVEKSEESADKGNKQRKRDRAIQARLRELEEISKKRRLTSKELAEAEDLRNRFTYKIKVVVDFVNGKVKTLGDFEFENLEKAFAVKDIQKQLFEIEEGLRRIKKSRNELSATEDDDKEDIKKLAAQETEYLRKQVELRQQLKSISRGEKNAIVGEEISYTGDNGAAANMSAAMQKVVDAQNHILEVEKEIAKFRRTSSQERLHQIEEERKKAMESLETVLNAEKEKYRQASERYAELGKGRSVEDINKDIAAANAKIKGASIHPSTRAEMEQRKKQLAELQTAYNAVRYERGGGYLANEYSKKIAELEEEIAVDEEMLKPFSEVQKQYDALIEERKKAKQAMADRAELKLGMVEAEAVIKENEKKLAAMKKFFDERKRLEEEDERERRKKYDDFLKDLDAKEQKDALVKAENKKIDELLKKGNASGAIAFINDLIGSASQAYAEARNKYESMKTAFSAETSDGGKGYSAREEKGLSEQQKAVEDAQRKLQGYRDRLLSAREALNQSAVATTGSFSLKALAAQLGGGTVAERTAKASEEQVRWQKKIYKKMEDNNGMAWS